MIKLVFFSFLLSSSILSGEINFPKPSTGVDPVTFDNKVAYFSSEKSAVVIIDSGANDATQIIVSSRAISMFQFNGELCVITVDGNIQNIDKNGNLTTTKILDNGGVISAASIGNDESFALLGFQDGDQGLKIILYSKIKGKFIGKVIDDKLPRGVLTSGRGRVWFNSEQKSFEIGKK